MFATEIDLVDIITSRQTHADGAAGREAQSRALQPLCPTLAEAESLVREVGEDIR
jgi:hypothetical protein